MTTRTDRECDVRMAALNKELCVRLMGLEKQLEERRQTVNLALEAIEDKADKVQIQQNEWRATVNDIMTHMITRAEYDDKHLTLVEKIDRADKANASARLQGIILTATMGGVFMMLAYLLYIHIR